MWRLKADQIKSWDLFQGQRHHFPIVLLANDPFQYATVCFYSRPIFKFSYYNVFLVTPVLKLMNQQQFNMATLLEAICEANPPPLRPPVGRVIVQLRSPGASESCEVSDRGFILVEKVEKEFSSTEQKVEEVSGVMMELGDNFFASSLLSRMSRQQEMISSLRVGAD